MALDFSSYSSVESGLFVKIVCTYYKATPSASPSTQTLRFSDLNRTVTVDGASYTGLGNLLGITGTSTELKVTNNDLTVTIAGIPNTSISEIINSRIKGSKITIFRAFYSATTGTILSVAGNPMTRYSGIINNYGINEEYDVDTRSASNTISLMCSSFIDILGNTTKGRRTNPEDEKRFFPSDLSMDRVPALNRSNFNFGAPQ